MSRISCCCKFSAAKNDNSIHRLTIQYIVYLFVVQGLGASPDHPAEHHFFLKGVLERVVLCVEDKATGRKLERFVWEIDFDMAASPALSTSSRVLTEPRNQEELEDALRQILLKISVSDSLLPPQKRKDVRKFLHRRQPSSRGGPLHISYIDFLRNCPIFTHVCVVGEQLTNDTWQVTFNLYVHTAEHRYAVDNDWEVRYCPRLSF